MVILGLITININYFIGAITGITLYIIYSIYSLYFGVIYSNSKKYLSLFLLLTSFLGLGLLYLLIYKSIKRKKT